MILPQLLTANQDFLSQKASDSAPHPSLPGKALAIVTCIDTRLVQFLEPALGLTRGEATIIKNAGNIVTGPDSDIIRSLIIAVYAQNCREIAIIGHTDCGMAKVNIQTLAENMLASGIDKIHTDWHEFGTWIGGFTDEADNIVRSAHMIRSSAKIPAYVPVHGLLLDIHTGEVKHLLTV